MEIISDGGGTASLDGRYRCHRALGYGFDESLCWRRMHCCPDGVVSMSMMMKKDK